MKIALIQLDIAWEDKAANYARAAVFIARARDEGAELVCLPELFATGFSMRSNELSEPSGGPTDEWIREQAATNGVPVLGTLIETSACGTLGRNTAVLYDPAGRELLRYAKIHPFSLLEENRHYEAGDHVPVIDFGGFRLAVAICYDLRFPETFRHATIVDRADLFLVPASWPTTRAAHWDLLLRARALENLAYVAGINRTGEGGGLVFDGRSQVVDPLGEVRARTVDEETIVMADVDPDRVAQVRSELAFLADAHFDPNAPKASEPAHPDAR